MRRVIVDLTQPERGPALTDAFPPPLPSPSTSVEMDSGGASVPESGVRVSDAEVEARMLIDECKLLAGSVTRRYVFMTVCICMHMLGMYLMLSSCLCFVCCSYLFDGSSNAYTPLPPVNRDDPSTYEHYTLCLLGRMSSLMNVGESYRQLLSNDTIGRLRICAVLLRDSCNAQERSSGSGLPSDMSALYSSLRQLAGNIVGGGIASLASLVPNAPQTNDGSSDAGASTTATSTTTTAMATGGRASAETRRSSRRRGPPREVRASSSSRSSSRSNSSSSGIGGTRGQEAPSHSPSTRGDGTSSNTALSFAETGRAMSQSFERDADSDTDGHAGDGL